MSNVLQLVRDSLLSGQRISASQALELYECTDLLELGRLAQLVRPPGCEDRCFLANARRIRYSNVCRNRCRYCRHGKEPEDPEAYTRSVSEIVDLAGEALEAGITQLQITGGVNPALPYDYYLEMAATLRRCYPQMHIQGFAPAQIVGISALRGVTFRQTLEDLRDAGLDSILEDGADIFDPQLRRIICDAKATGAQWIQVMRDAHEIGVPGGAGMLYGHLETPRHKVQHLYHLRDLQDDLHSLAFYAPRAYRPNGRPAGDVKGVLGGTPGGGTDDLREFAIGRIFLNDVPGIRCYANDLGMKTTQIALHFGVNSVVVVVRDGEPLDDETRAAKGMPNFTQLREIIERAGFRPEVGTLTQAPIANTATAQPA